MKLKLTTAASALCISAGAAVASCPEVTISEANGVSSGAFPQQFELAEFESLADCTLEFATNPDSADLNARITGNPDLLSDADRIPAEPLVVAPYDETGSYGGILDVLSNATEAGGMDGISIRHVNFVRFADDL
ncbi:MAG: hypothetical protein AAGA28_08545 [Pseudomonadota bacterium]